MPRAWIVLVAAAAACGQSSPNTRTSAAIVVPTVAPEPAPYDTAGPLATAPSEPTYRDGIGSCASDADCVVSNVLDPAEVGDHACCSYVCPPGNVASRALADAIAARKSAACRGDRLCPPPAPCRRSDVVLVPRCRDQLCAGEVRAHGAPAPEPLE